MGDGAVAAIRARRLRTARSLSPTRRRPASSGRTIASGTRQLRGGRSLGRRGVSPRTGAACRERHVQQAIGHGCGSPTDRPTRRRAARGSRADGMSRDRLPMPALHVSWRRRPRTCFARDARLSDKRRRWRRAGGTDLGRRRPHPPWLRNSARTNTKLPRSFPSRSSDELVAVQRDSSRRIQAASPRS